MRVKCPAKEHSTTSPGRAQNWSARSGVERTTHGIIPLDKLFTLPKWLSDHDIIIGQYTAPDWLLANMGTVNNIII